MCIPNESKEKHFHWIEWDVNIERSFEESSDGGFRFKPDSSQSEQECSTHSTEEPSPVVPHSKVSRRYLDTEQHPCIEKERV